jgi:cytoskeletal protein CcmA (bactofilin family)
MAEVRIKDIDEQEIDTILAEDIDFEGHLTFKKPLMIKGKFKGEIKSTSSLYIGEKAYVEATTEAGVVSSKGRHKGNILGYSRVELNSTAQVDGDITTPDFIMESGCKFNGFCNMSGESRKDDQQPSNGQPHAQGSAGQGQSQGAGQQQKPAQPAAGAAAPHAGPQQQVPAPQHQQPQGQQQAQQQKPPAPPAGQGGPQK